MARRGKFKVLDPSGGPVAASLSLAPRLESLDGLVIGLLDNDKPKADKLLLKVKGILEQRYRFADVIMHRKPTTTRPAPEEIIDDLAKRCHLVITAVGD